MSFFFVESFISCEMPEGPSVVLLKDEVQQFVGKKIISVKGNSKIEQSRLINRHVISFNSWGKHFLICLKDFTLRIHFLMFGTYRINEEKTQAIRLNLTFKMVKSIFTLVQSKY